MDELTLIKEFVEADKVKKDLEQKLSEATLICDKAEYNLLEYMEDKEIERTAHYSGIGYVTKKKPSIHASCSAENKEKLFEFLKERGRDDMIKTDVNASSLSSFTKQEIESGNPIPEFISYYIKNKLLIYNK